MIKLIALVLLSSWLILVKDARLLALVFAVNLAIICFSRRRQELYSRLKFLAILIGLVFLLQLLARQPLSLLPSLRVGALSLLVLTYTSLTSVREISRAFRFLGPKSQLLITLTLNLIPIILREAQNIRLVQLSRGAKNPLAIFVPLLHRTFARAQQLALVLEMKSGQERSRTSKSVKLTTS